MTMRNRIVVIMLVLAYLCGCQSSDPYVRRSELRKESKQIAQAQTSQAMTALDEKYRGSIEGLTSATDRNAESISALESKLGTVAAQNAKAISGLKSGLQADITASTSSTKQNTESISRLEATVNDVAKQSAQSVADVSSGLRQLEEQAAQFRLDVHQEFAREEADRIETTSQLAEKTDQLAEKINLSDNRLQKMFLGQVTEAQSDKGTKGENACLPVRLRPSVPAVQKRHVLCQPYFAAIGPLVIVSGPLVAELCARKQKRLARSLARSVVQIPTR